MFNSPSPLAYPNYSRPSPNPQEVELMMKQKFNQTQQMIQPPQQVQQSDPYQEFQQIMSSCSTNTRYKIMNDDEYKECDMECELLLKQAIEEAMIPQLLLIPQGRITFEKFAGVAKKLRDKYSQEEVETNQQLQRLMQDEVVMQRLKELSMQEQTSKGGAQQ